MTPRRAERPAAEAKAEVVDRYPSDSPHTPSAVTIIPGYEPLARILQAALDQAQCGKGKRLHANDSPFLEQPIITEGSCLRSWRTCIPSPQEDPRSLELL